jgi:hypothetical protein
MHDCIIFWMGGMVLVEIVIFSVIFYEYTILHV